MTAPTTGASARGFHGWRMVGAGTGLQFLQAGLMQQAFGAYVAVLSTERGWSKTALSGAAALQSVETAIIGPLLGWMIDRLGAQRLIRWGVLIFGAGLIAMGCVDSLAGFYAAVIVIALGTSLCGYFPINVAIIHWFERKRARALSTVGLGLALGGLFVPVVAGSIVTFGWRATAIGSGVLAIAVGWPLARVFKGTPAELGQTVDGLPPEPAPAAGAQDTSPPEFTAREALRTRAFWLLSVGHGFALLVVTAVNVHAITHMKETLGYSVAQASLVITLMTAAQVAGVLTGMTIGDRFEKRLVAAACMLMHAAGLLMLTYATGPAMLVAFAVLHGTAWGLRGPFMQAIRADYFGRRSIGMIMGLSAVIIAVGQVGGPMVAGGFADLTGDYRVGFTLLALLAAGGSVAFAVATRPARPRRAADASPGSPGSPA
ncbi:MAG: MFS transporter [Burkholderiales bacterium]|nr:MAG: MFS transporter [Burkholderiales bacterium]